MDNELERIARRKINLKSSCRAAYNALLYIQIYIQNPESKQHIPNPSIQQCLYKCIGIKLYLCIYKSIFTRICIKVALCIYKSGIFNEKLSQLINQLIIFYIAGSPDYTRPRDVFVRQPFLYFFNKNG